MAEIYTFSVESSDNGVRIDVFLTEKLDISRTFVRRQIKEGSLSVNGKSVTKPGAVLREGDDVRFAVRDLREKMPVAETVDLKIYFEDAHCMVIEKPAGMLTHPAGKRVTGTLVNALMGRFDTMGFSADLCRPGIVHRLDEDTSGIMVVTKTPEAMKKFAQMFEKRKIEKKYLTLIVGKLEPKEGSIDAPLIRSGEAMKVSGSQQAKSALTHYAVKEYIRDAYSYLEIQIITGRTHQIRVHLSAINHPIVGDQTYGSAAVNEEFEEKFGLKRQFLHAYSLKFTHPFTGEAMHFESDLPEDLEKIIDSLHKN